LRRKSAKRVLDTVYVSIINLTKATDGVKTVHALGIAAIWLATCLPLPLLAQSLWIDEASSIWFARLSLGDLLLHLCDPHPPGYYLLLKGWLALGETEHWVRALSLFASVLAVALTARAAYHISGARAGVLSALLLITFPLQSWYAAEARMYTLVQALGVSLLILAWRLLFWRGGDLGAVPARRWAIAGFWLLAVAALVIDISALMPYIVLQLWWLARGRPHASRWVRLQIAVLIPVMIGWSIWQVGADTYQPIFVAIQARRLGVPLEPRSAAQLLLVFATAVGLLSLAVAWRLSDEKSHLRRLTASPGMAYLLVVIWLLLLVFSAVPRLFSLKRLLVVLLPHLTLLLASRLSPFRARVKWGLIALNLVVTLWMLMSFQREPWRQVVATLSRASTGRPVIVWVDDLAVPAFDYYYRRMSLNPTNIAWAPLRGSDLPALPSLIPPSGGDLWVVLIENPYRNLSVFLPAEFHQKYQLLDEHHFPGVAVRHYRRLSQPLTLFPLLPEPSPEALWGLQLPSPLVSCR
jgi:uncharacterized membrane protein